MPLNAQQPPASPLDSLASRLDEAHRRITGRAYVWKDVDRAVLDELCAEGFTPDDIATWWEGALKDKARRVRYLRELKAVMLKEATPSRDVDHSEVGMVQSTNTEVIPEETWQLAARLMGYGPSWEDDPLERNCVTTVARELAWGKPADLVRILRAFRAPAASIAQAEQRQAVLVQ